MAYSRKMQQLAQALGMFGWCLTSARGTDNQKPWRVSRKGDQSGEHYRFSNLDEVQQWFLDNKAEWILQQWQAGGTMLRPSIHMKPRE